MPKKFYLKSHPGLTIMLQNGTPWKNWTVIDHEWGVISPQNEYLAEALAACVRQGVGGVSEITEAEFNEWLKKKLTVLPPRWRDEWQKPLALPSTDRPLQSQGITSQPPSAAPVVTNFRPNAVKA